MASSDPENPPLISVLMPVYNAAPYLVQAIESLLQQTYPSFELIAVNDGSEDESAALLERMAAKDARIRIFQRPHEGLPRTRNFCIAQARGEFLANLDADDIAFPNRLELQLAYVRAHPDCVVVGAGARKITPEGYPIADIPIPLTGAEIEKNLLSGWGGAIVHTTAMFRAAAVRQVGGYDERFAVCEDLDLYLKLAEIGTIANMAEVLVYFRRHAESTSLRSHEDYKETILQEVRARRNIVYTAHSLRPFVHPQSQAELYMIWMFQSLMGGNWKTAGRYGWRFIKAGRKNPRLCGGTLAKWAWHKLSR